MPGRKRVVHLPYPQPALLMRQTPGGQGVWSNLRFMTGPHVSDADYLVARGDVIPGTITDIPKERRLLVTSEPPGILDYRSDFLNQFGILVSPYQIEGFAGRTILSQPALRWWLGINLDAAQAAPAMNFGDLERLSWPEKTKTLSVVASTKAILPKHRARLAFIEKAAKRFGAEMDVFGRGFQPIADKADAILPYRYHLVLENNDIPNFWTEKLADAYLGYAFPFFSGCANLTDYFPADSFLAIDIDNPERTLDAIEAAIEEDLAGLRRPRIEAARHRLLYEHNFFALIERIVRDLDDGAGPDRLNRPEAVHPVNRPSRLKAARRWIRSKLGINQNLRKPRR